MKLIVDRDESMPVRSSEDIMLMRRAVRKQAVALGFSLVDQTKIVTAASEIGRNTLDYGGGGELRIECLRDSSRRGLRLTFTDAGPGIADVTLALRDGYTSGGGLGLGLGGAKRLCNDFDIRTAPGRGTTIILARWRMG
jgi:serine/threonine-protein kinase RsbT